MASRQYGTGTLGIINRDINLLGSTIKCMLVTPSYTYNADHDFVNDVSTNELNGTGYANGFSGAGRKTLASKALALNGGSTRVEFDAADLTWTALAAAAGDIGGAILYQEGTSDTDSRLIAFLDPADLTPNGSDVTLSWNSGGILYWTVPATAYPTGWLQIINRTIDLVGGTIKMALAATGYTYSAAHVDMADITELANGTGYAGGFAGAGRKTLASKAIANDTTNDRIEFDFADPVWTGLNAGTVGGAFVYANGSADSDSILIHYDNTTDIPSNGGDVTYTVNAEGLLQWSYAS